MFMLTTGKEQNYLVPILPELSAQEMRHFCFTVFQYSNYCEQIRHNLKKAFAE